MDDLIVGLFELVTEIFGESILEKFFPRLTPYPLLPQKERSSQSTLWLKFLCYLPAVLALLALSSPVFCLMVAIKGPALVGCCIAATIGLWYLIAIYAINLIASKK